MQNQHYLRNSINHVDAAVCSIKDMHRWHPDNGWSGCGHFELYPTDCPENIYSFK